MIAAPSFADDPPPATEQARKVEALVIKAAALADKDGKAAFAEFRKKDSEWFHGDTYLFAYDLKGNVLLNPAFPQREGTNVAGQKDAKGKPFQDEIIQVAATKGSGWVSYMFPKPGQISENTKAGAAIVRAPTMANSFGGFTARLRLASFGGSGNQ